jgi:hypothetical protein
VYFVIFVTRCTLRIVGRVLILKHLNENEHSVRGHTYTVVAGALDSVTWAGGCWPSVACKETHEPFWGRLARGLLTVVGCGARRRDLRLSSLTFRR